MKTNYKDKTSDYAGMQTYKKRVLFDCNDDSWRIMEYFEGSDYADAYVELPVGIDYSPDYAHVSIRSSVKYGEEKGWVRVPVPGGFAWCKVFASQKEED